MSKFVVASRRRDYIDLPHYFGKYEFSVVPRSMFRQDGSLLLGCDKASVMHQIEELMGKKKENMETENLLPENLVPETSHRKVIILDGMAVVNQIKKTSQIKTCKDLAGAFIQKVLYESRGHEEVRMIFDRYQENSIKDPTRSKRTQGVTIRYKISDDTNIEGVTMKKLLSHITKQHLTKFIGDHLAKELESLGKQ